MRRLTCIVASAILIPMAVHAEQEVVVVDARSAERLEGITVVRQASRRWERAAAGTFRATDASQVTLLRPGYEPLRLGGGQRTVSMRRLREGAWLREVSPGTFYGNTRTIQAHALRLERAGVGRVVHQVLGARPRVLFRLRGAVARPLQLDASARARRLAELSVADRSRLVSALRATRQGAAARARPIDTSRQAVERPRLPRNPMARFKPGLGLGVERSTDYNILDDPARTITRYETSEQLIGRVAVNLLLISSDDSGRRFSADDREAAIGDLIEAMDAWAQALPKSQLSFHYRVYHVKRRLAPINSTRQAQYSAWLSDALQQATGREATSLRWASAYYGWNNEARDTLGCDWAFTCVLVRGASSVGDLFDAVRNGGKGTFVFRDGQRAFAYLGGPLMVVPYARVMGLHFWNVQTIAHEFGHVFYAEDEYAEAIEYSGLNFTDRYGYHGVINGNLDQPGAPSSTSCVMRDRTPGLFKYAISVLLGRQNSWSMKLCDYTRAQVGYRDSDSDGKLDVIDVRPEISLRIRRPANGMIYIEGPARVGAYPNLNPYNGNLFGGWMRRSRHGINIDRIALLRFRVDYGKWVEIPEAVGRRSLKLLIQVGKPHARTFQIRMTTQRRQYLNLTYPLPLGPPTQRSPR